ncbi:hypothetical protein ANN_05832 [Periplaneta americana]|uniref:Transposase n=1 Tax=Periplaneta americana TaxID=6978 RepID=A0ABQ8TBX1_PERAM|nr:hypothetical protein ANN_05832 [Periplaneta americana]
MPRGKPLSYEEKTRINDYKELKLSNRQIAKKLGRSRYVIDNFVKLDTQYDKMEEEGQNIFSCWTSEWGQVIFSDEKKFNLDGPDGFLYYWHDLRTEDQVRMSRNFGGGSVMIWAAFCAQGTSNLAWVHTRMNSDTYTEMLGLKLVRMYEEFGGKLIFQQNNAAIHVSAKSEKWFLEKGIALLTGHQEIRFKSHRKSIRDPRKACVSQRKSV